MTNVRTVHLEPWPLQPCPIKGQLATVKRGIFNPDLPTLRHMERDEMMHRLSDEHCRHTTRCTAKQFRDVYRKPFQVSVAEEPKCLTVTETGRAISRYYNTPGTLQRSHMIWSQQINDPCKRERLNSVPAVNFEVQTDDWHFDGVALRVIRPELRNWRATFKCEPGLDQSGRRQRVTPSNILNRHRATHT